VSKQKTYGVCRCTHRRTVSGNRCTECHGSVAPDTSREHLRDGDADWSAGCTACGATPTVHPTGLCGPCCFGEADTHGGNW
jgi:hypothetical protein